MNIHAEEAARARCSRGAVVAGSFVAAAPGVLAQVGAYRRYGLEHPCARRSRGALPVLTLDRQYIEQSGADQRDRADPATPQVQNFVASSTGVNGSGRGNTTAALHAAVQVHAGPDRRRAPASGGAQQLVRRRFRRRHPGHPAGCRRARGNPAGWRHRSVRRRCGRRRGQLHSRRRTPRSVTPTRSTPGRPRVTPKA